MFMKCSASFGQDRNRATVTIGEFDRGELITGIEKRRSPPLSAALPEKQFD
jgi:hypothetical protein